ncbi:hypothetical protein F183_A41890 [Bryobacterales bacterium F-183]|nr:hypothetical protein F183_A41890 [Bryobacterales bacterium F-183]
MEIKRAIRAFFRYTLLDQVFEFVYWIAALAGLVLLGSGSNTPLLIAGMVAYGVAIVVVYFAIVRRLKKFFDG